MPSRNLSRARMADVRAMAISAKEAAKQTIACLPEQAAWDQIMYRLHVRRKIEEGLRDSDAGRVVPHEEAKRRMLKMQGK